MEEHWELDGQNIVIADDYRQNLHAVSRVCHTQDSEDVVLKEFTVWGRPAFLLFVDGLVDRDSVQRFLLEPLLRFPEPKAGASVSDSLSASLPLASIAQTSSMKTLVNRVFSGDAALFISGMTGALIADMKGFVKRGLSEPHSETVVIGPHEGFTESLRDNTVLIRRMMRTPALISREISVGSKIPCRIVILYLNGAAKQENVDEVMRRLMQCNVDYISSIGMLEQLLEDDPYALLPQIASTERPDRAVGFLNEGQIVIAMENAPSVLALPISFLHLIHTPDDTALRWQYGTFLRLLRILGFILALVLPALFLSLTVFHPEGLSLSLLTSVVESQERVPLSLFSSTLIMLVIFSLINEACSRVPGVMGASLSIVGGLILGQAVVEADLFSPLVLIVVALSGLGGYAAPSHPLTIALRILQLLLTLSAGFGGYPGLIITLFALSLQAFGQTSLGHPFFSPLFPKRPRNPDAALRLPIFFQRLRGAFANPFQMERVRGAMRAWDHRKEQP